MTIKEVPLGDRVLVELDAEEKVSNGGIIIETASNKYDTQYGTIVAIGEQAFTETPGKTPWVKVGDRVSFLRYAGKLLHFDSKDYRIIMDTDLYTKVIEE